jgi:uncharacterized protein (DUF1501 family)
VVQLKRREFLTITGGLIVGLGTLSRTGRVQSAGVSTAPPPGGRSLVVIYLGGGNDGLNTVAPFGQGAYYDARPTLAIKESEALPLTGKLGLHPNLKGLKALYDQGKVAIIQGVGYPEPNRSHFRSFDIWATAQPKGVAPIGWLGKYLDRSGGAQGNPLRAVAVGSAIPKPLVGVTPAAIAIERLDGFSVKGTPAAQRAVRAMYGVKDGGPMALIQGRGQAALDAADAVQKLAGGYVPGVTYPQRNRLAANLQLIAQLLAGGSPTQLFYTTLGGFDDHANEKAGHDALLGELDGAIAAFQADLEAQGLADRVVTFVHSEFGRRVKENGSGGTDHGAAGPALLIGKPVAGGMVGDHPSLTDLLDGDLKYTIDFRSIYATLLDRWLDGPAEEVLAGRFERLPLFEAVHGSASPRQG